LKKILHLEKMTLYLRRKRWKRLRTISELAPSLWSLRHHCGACAITVEMASVRNAGCHSDAKARMCADDEKTKRRKQQYDKQNIRQLNQDCSWNVAKKVEFSWNCEQNLVETWNPSKTQTRVNVDPIMIREPSGNGLFGNRT
jgi:hypothetical protein